MENANSAAQDATSSAAEAHAAALSADTSATAAQQAASNAHTAATTASTAAETAQQAADNATASATAADNAANTANTAAQATNAAVAAAEQAIDNANAATTAAQAAAGSATTAAQQADDAAVEAINAKKDATAAAGNAQQAADNAMIATASANTAAVGASKVNAVLNGSYLTITDRQGSSKSVDVKGEDAVIYSFRIDTPLVVNGEGKWADTNTDSKSIVIRAYKTTGGSTTAANVIIEAVSLTGELYPMPIYASTSLTLNMPATETGLIIRYYKFVSTTQRGDMLFEQYVYTQHNGINGKDYTLTEADKQEIAEIVSADFVNVEEEGA